MNTIKRYPGVRPFEFSDQALYFGRESDIRDLCDLIRLEKLVVLFGRSGYGKSSLINAGVLPLLAAPDKDRHNTPAYTPVVVRFGEYIPDSSLSPIELLRRRITESVPASPIMTFVDQLQLPESLWRTLKRRQQMNPAAQDDTADDHTEHPGFLIVFDQFEEFFSYPPDQQLDFRSQLADVLYGDMPQEAREGARSLPLEQRRMLVSALNLRSLFAIRSDRLSELDRLRDHLPAILHKRYELKALTREQARDGIVIPARIPYLGIKGTASEVQFYSPPFEYGADALDKILNDLSVSSAQGQTGVEAFQLQILCDTIEGMVVDGKIADRDGNGLPDVMASDLPDFSDVYGAYYERRLSMLPDNLRAAARLVIEDGLVRLDPATGEGRRLSMDSEALIDQFAHAGASKAMFKELENTFLLRRERNTTGGHNYELSHDTLLAPVLRAKKRRIDARERDLLAKRRRRAVSLIVSGAVLMVLALAAAVYAINWYMSAKAQQAEAEKAYEKLEKTAIQVVDAFTREANSFMYKLDYAKASTRLKKAAELEHRTEEFKKAVLEVAFFYNESDKLTDALGILDTAGFLANRTLPSSADAIRAFIQAQNPGWFDTLQLRYFPSMLAVNGGEFEFNKKVQATVSAFRLGKTEVTYWQMEVFDAANGMERQMPVWGLYGDNPAVYVTWFDALAYANWLSRKQGLQPVYTIEMTPSDTVVQVNWEANGYRLPTETEWEYAAKDGPLLSNYAYSGGNNLDDVAWWGNNSGQVHGVKRSNAVATRQANQLGFYDMTGNVWEWCWDWYGAGLDRPEPDYRGPADGRERILRGGSWFLSKEILFNSNYRFRYDPSKGINVIGFRLARKPV